ncbi:dual OB domain-containing protein [Agrococcus jenensis]|nr:hypothetical protein [Agrococcus jenensis]
MTRDPQYPTLLLLANSRKLSGRCMAGIELVDGAPAGWVRPVSARPHGEVSEIERQYEDGSDPKVLDVARVPLLRPAPAEYQTENWLLDPNYYWKHEGEATAADLSGLTDARDLWLANDSSTRHGLHDRVPQGTAQAMTDSLRLIHVDDLKYRVFAPSADYNNFKRRVQAAFTHGSESYRMMVTDPLVERAYVGLEQEDHFIGAAYLTVSLGEAYEGYAYKLVAAVILG